MRLMCNHDFDLDNLDQLGDTEEYIHEDSCLVEVQDTDEGHVLIMSPLYNLKNFDEGDEFDVNNHGYCSLIINTLLYPYDIPKREVRDLFKFVLNLLFVANPELIGKSYIDEVLASRSKERLDELCEYLVEGIERKIEYTMSQEDHPLF